MEKGAIKARAGKGGWRKPVKDLVAELKGKRSFVPATICRLVPAAKAKAES